jgi:hypothetical protein
METAAFGLALVTSIGRCPHRADFSLFEQMEGDEDYGEAKVTVLAENVRHHQGGGTREFS